MQLISVNIYVITWCNKIYTDNIDMHTITDIVADSGFSKTPPTLSLQ